MPSPEPAENAPNPDATSRQGDGGESREEEQHRARKLGSNAEGDEGGERRDDHDPLQDRDDLL